jgi:hypothetical protein
VYRAELGDYNPWRDPNVRCPFHNDRSPSMFISPEGVWYCQPCARGGNLWTLLMELHGLDWVGATRRALEILGIEDDSKRAWGYSSARDVVAIARKERRKTVQKLVAEWYRRTINDKISKARDLERTARSLWRWSENKEARKMVELVALHDKCVQWSSEAKALDEEVRGLERARSFEERLIAFELHHGETSAEELGLTREELDDVRNGNLQPLGRAAGQLGRPARQDGGLFGGDPPAPGDPGAEPVET